MKIKIYIKKIINHFICLCKGHKWKLQSCTSHGLKKYNDSDVGTVIVEIILVKEQCTRCGLSTKKEKI